MLSLTTLKAIIPSLLLSLVPLSVAATPAPETLLDQQREQFLEVEGKAKRGELRLTDPEYAALHNYPLYPYLEYNRIVALGSAISEAEILRFRAQFPDSHLNRLLRSKLMDNLIRQGEWQTYSRYYEELSSPGSEEQCLYARALYRKGDKRAAYELGRGLWVVGHSQHQACDPLFSEMRADGELDSKLALERVLNALDENRSSLATYAKRFITQKSLEHIATDAIAVYRAPEKIVQLNRALQGELQARLQHIAVQRAYRNSPERAMDLLLKLGKQYSTTDENVRLLGRVGVRIAKELRSDDRSRLAQLDPDFLSSDLTEWRIRLALQDQDWHSVNRLINHLPDELQQDNRWLYWRAIATERSGGSPNFQPLLQERSFYGFIAAQLESQPYQLNQQSPIYTDALLLPLRQSASMARIKELVKLDRYSVARSEWNAWIEQLDSQQRQAAARLMVEIGWYQMGILAAAYEGFWNDMLLRFPEAYTDYFVRESSQRGIDPLWSLAVSRQESALFPWARSPVGARGLMQLMPKTAKQTAQRERIPYRGGHELYEARTNIRLGTAYLAQMAEQFGGNRAHATAAYNAGPHRVSRWLEGRESLPLDIWIELIPFDETRTYVQNVLSFRVIYAQLRGEPRPLFSEPELRSLVLASR